MTEVPLLTELCCGKGERALYKYFAAKGPVGKSRRDATFIESSIPIDLRSPFMAERRLVALLKELPSLFGVWFSINISPLRGFSDRLLRGLD